MLNSLSTHGSPNHHEYTSKTEEHAFLLTSNDLVAENQPDNIAKEDVTSVKPDLSMDTDNYSNHEGDQKIDMKSNYIRVMNDRSVGSWIDF